MRLSVAVRAFLLLALTAVSPAFVRADLADEVIARVLSNVAKAKAADPEAVPMAFWDFDGTILKGDISVGLEDGGEPEFKGLLQRTIEEGYSPIYDRETGWARFWQTDYPQLKKIGLWLAWPFTAQVYAGTRTEALDAFCRREVETVYRRWYFVFSYKVFTALRDAGVENYIISGSPEIFVRNAAESLGIPRDHMRGMRVVESGGRMTTELMYPLPFAEGKIENLREFVGACPHGIALAAFGNSYMNDAPFMRYVATQSGLPGGARGTAVMINGIKKRAGYEEHFIKTDETEVIGEKDKKERK